VEGANTANDWWAWERTGRSLSGEASGEACDHYKRFDDDFRLAAGLGHTAHRFSIEWSRIEPRPGEFDPVAIEHYRQVLASLHRHGLVPVVTLWHFTLPAWVARVGGWTNRNTVTWFTRFVERIARDLGEGVPYWITVNEPNVYVLQSYFLGIWPPQKRSIPGAVRVHQALVRAHRAAYAVLKARFGDRTHVGFAGNFNAFEPLRPRHVLDRAATRLVDFFWNTGFLRQVIRTSDFVGINYYFHSRVRFSPLRFDLLFTELHDGGGRDRSDLGWELYPLGIEQVVRSLSVHGKPLMVTENGLADAADSRRSQFLISHLTALHRAMVSGARVLGYLHWSLLDNFEWADGFAPRFGLVAVDYATQQRTPRPSAELFRRIIHDGGLSAATLARAGNPR
jgi:beta-glucosidase